MKRRDFERLQWMVIPFCACSAAFGSALVYMMSSPSYPTYSLYFEALLTTIPTFAVVAMMFNRMSKVWGFAAAWYSLTLQMLVMDLSSRHGITWGFILKDVIFIYLASFWSYMFYFGSKSAQVAPDKPILDELPSES